MKPDFVDRCLSESKNFIPLSPISFLERASLVYGDKTSILYGSSISFSWKETHRRCLNLAASLVRFGLSRHDVVVAFAPNVPALYELHFAVPMAGGILSPLNFCLDDTTLALILLQLQPMFIFVDPQFLNVVLKALDSLNKEKETLTIPTLVLIPEPHHNKNSLTDILSYEDLVNYDHDPGFEIIQPRDERDPISVSYTSGSTGSPKGAVYSHRAVYLNSMAVIVSSEMRHSSVFLWTVDMFRCNGWCYPWATAALGATNVCLKSNSGDPEAVLDAVSLHGVTHFCGKPAILEALARAAKKPPLEKRVEVLVAGALPSLETLERVTEMGFNVSRGYGMTEALGPAVIEPWLPTVKDQAPSLSCVKANYNKYMNRLLTVDSFDVKNPKTMVSVPADGETAGELMLRGNTMMSGYVGKSKEAFREGWYKTGDIGVRHSDGSVEVKDRAEDAVAVRGARSVISSLEIEAALMRHPKVSEAAVVGHGGEDGNDDQVPWAFVKLKEGFESNSEEIVEFCGGVLPGYMVPQAVVFGDLPVNSTGKVQKFVLRYKANNSFSTSNGSYGSYSNGIA